MTTALVTGANKGVGFATAKALAAVGINVWLGARSAERGEAAAAQLRSEGLPVRFVPIDVSDGTSIKAAAMAIEVDGGGLDVLVNNAGIMTELISLDPPKIQMPSEIPMEQLRLLFETNFFGVVAVTQAFMPLLRQSVAGRIVNVASRLGSSSMMAEPGNPMRGICMLGYGGSKAAMAFATIAFAHELVGTRIKVNAVSPGTIVTDLSGVPKEELARRSEQGTPEDGAMVILRYATLPDDGPTGGLFGPGGACAW